MKLVIRISRTIFVIFFLFVFGELHSQNNIFLGQYFKLLPSFAPGLNGVNDFLDIRTGSRYQWIEYDGAPRTFWVAAYSPLTLGETNAHKYNSVKVADLSPYRKKETRIAVGGHIFDDYSGGFRQLETMASLAVHIPVESGTKVSLGVSMGNFHTGVAVSKLFVLRPENDQTFQSYMSGVQNFNQFKLDVGGAVYSERYYFSYSLLNVGSSTKYLMKDELSTGSLSLTKVHNVIAGMIFSAGASFEIISSLYLRHMDGFSTIFDTGFRVRYQQNPYLGFAVRNNKTFIAMIGATLSDKLDFGYAYEYSMSNKFFPNANTHELTLGLRLFNNHKYVPLW